MASQNAQTYHLDRQTFEKRITKKCTKDGKFAQISGCLKTRHANKTIMNQTPYRDARLTGIRHDAAYNKMVLYFEDQPDWEIHSVVDFSLTGFFPQNILFGIYEYDINNLPARIAAEFPVLSYYLHSGENWQIFHISPQAGLGGIIVCATF